MAAQVKRLILRGTSGMTIHTARKNAWTEPKLEQLDVDLTSVASGNNYFDDNALSNNLSRKS